MNEMLKNKMVKVIEKDGLLTDDVINEFQDGVDKIYASKTKINTLIGETKQQIINNSVHLLIQRLMNDDKDGVIEMLDNNRHVIDIFNFTEILNDLLTEYSIYRNLYREEYPEIKKIKETLALKEKELLPLLTEIINDRK